MTRDELREMAKRYEELGYDVRVECREFVSLLDALDAAERERDEAQENLNRVAGSWHEIVALEQQRDEARTRLATVERENASAREALAAAKELAAHELAKRETVECENARLREAARLGLKWALAEIVHVQDAEEYDADIREIEAAITGQEPALAAQESADGE